MKIYDIISNGERIVVYACEDEKAIYTWNQSLTLQKWCEVDVYAEDVGADVGKWEERDVWTLSDAPAGWKEAQDKVRELWKV